MKQSPTNSQAKALAAQQPVRLWGFTSKQSGKRPLTIRRRRRVIKYGLLAVNVTLLGAAGFTVLFGGKASDAAIPNPASLSATESVNPLDTVSATDIAATVSRIAGLSEAAAVANQANTADFQLTRPVTDNALAVKPMITSTNLKSKSDIAKYTVKSGDTVSNIAARFGVTSDSLRWSNGLNGDVVQPGKELLISPISNGFVYKVRPGDTPDSLAQTFRANKDKLIAFNDAELSGLKPGELIVIPDGTMTTPSYNGGNFLGGGFAWGGNSPIYNGNGYDYGQCTYWVALRRQQIGNPVPSNLGNAITWVELAKQAGLATGNEPRKGAVIWTPPSMMSGYYASYGHVGFVEDVLPDGTVKVSDMNVKGWNVVSSRTLTSDQARAYSYIY